MVYLQVKSTGLAASWREGGVCNELFSHSFLNWAAQQWELFLSPCYHLHRKSQMIKSQMGMGWWGKETESKDGTKSWKR